MRFVAVIPILLAVACGGAPAAGSEIPTTTAPIVRTDIARTQAVSGIITYGVQSPVVALGTGVVTWLPVEGTVVDRGQRLYAVDGRPTILLRGAMPAYRAMSIGTSGADVKQLEQNLLELGYATSANLVADGNFTSADAAAVRRWQRALGSPQTGVVDLGAVLFLSAPVRVGAVQLTEGTPIGPGTAVLTTTPTDVHVNVALDTAFVAFVHGGDQVRVTLPDLSSTVTGRVASVAATATVAAQPNQAPRPTVAVRIDVDDPHRLQAYDQAPVQVAITIEVHRGVLAVPVLSLLAEPGEKYAVRLVRGGTRALVDVVPGIQGTNGLIEVTGSGIAAGDLVEVPVQ